LLVPDPDKALWIVLPFDRRASSAKAAAMPIADNVHRLRVTDGLTIEELAEAAHLSAALVASIENGRRSVPQKAVRALAAHFGIGVEALLR
jgi:ribosome-binding protein aMBF1 (putative translation factor)